MLSILNLPEREWSKNRSLKSREALQGAKELKSLTSSEEIHIQTKSGNSKPASIRSQHSTVAHTVCTSNGSEYCRNRHHLSTTRPLRAKENPRGQGDKPETFTAPLEGHESVEETLVRLDLLLLIMCALGLPF